MSPVLSVFYLKNCPGQKKNKKGPWSISSSIRFFCSCAGVFLSSKLPGGQKKIDRNLAWSSSCVHRCCHRLTSRPEAVHCTLAARPDSPALPPAPAASDRAPPAAELEDRPQSSALRPTPDRSGVGLQPGNTRVDYLQFSFRSFKEEIRDSPAVYFRARKFMAGLSPIFSSKL